MGNEELGPMGEQPHRPLGPSRNQLLQVLPPPTLNKGLGCAPTGSHQPLVEGSSWEVEGIHSNLPRGWQSGSWGLVLRQKDADAVGPGYTVRSGTYTTHSSLTCAPTTDPFVSDLCVSPRRLRFPGQGTVHRGV